MDKKSRAYARKMLARAEKMEPKIVSASPGHANREIASSVLPDGASLAKKANAFSPWSGSTSFGGSGGGASYHTQRPYLPEFDSPERQFYPYDRCEANKYWRMFYKFDPFFGTAVDMYSQMMVSDFDIIIENSTDQTIKNQLMDMSSDTMLLDKLQTMVKEYLVLGEAFPHNFFDEEKGVWSYIGFHDPDYMDVQDSPIIDMDPILSFIPDSKLKALLTDNTPESIELRKRLPNEFVSRVLANQKIRLSPVNCSYIPRKLHPYDERGVSLASRLWRIWMVEDSVYNSTIQMFRRHANALKVIKLGDPATGWIPSPETESKWLQMVAQAEMDPNSWLIGNYGVNFEQWGGSDRAITLSREHDTIEKVKLVALGLSKSFMTGEVSFSCFVKDTKILMPDGSYKGISEVQKGEKVVDRFGNAKTVVDTFKYDSPDELVEITLRGGKTLTLTHNHKLPVFTRPRKCLCGCGETLGDRKTSSQGRMTWSSFKNGHHQRGENRGRSRVWTEYKQGPYTSVKYPENHDPYRKLEAGDIKLGDYLMIPRKFEDSGVTVTSANLSKARLLGYYVAEGNVEDITPSTGSKAARFTFGETEKEEFLAKDAIRLATSLGYTTSLYPAPTKHTVYFHTSATELAKWFEANGNKYSLNKSFSKEVMGWDLELKKELLKGMYRGDGHLSQTNAQFDVIYTTISKKLSMQLELILAQLGYYSYTCEWAPFTDDRGYNHKRRYNIEVSGLQARSLAELIWKDVPLYWEKVDMAKFDSVPGQGTKITSFYDDDYVYVPIKEIKRVQVDNEENPYVYSLEVEDSHSYVAENIASFNSAKSGLQVFLRRLLNMRQFFERSWILPKFFNPIIQINDWVKSTPSEVNHRYRIKRTAQENAAQGLYIKPKIKWKNKLDPTVDEETMRAYLQLKNFGFEISKDSIGAVVSLDWKNETKKRAEEFKEREELLTEILGPSLKQKYEKENEVRAKPPGTQGGGALPGGGASKPSGGQPVSNPPGSAPDNDGPGDFSLDKPNEGMPDTII